MRFSEKLLSYFPTPYFLNMPHVGIDITPNSIRFIEIKKTPGSFKIGKYGTVPLSSPVVFDETLINNQDLISTLTKISQTHKISFVEASIPEVMCYLYTVEVPVGDDAGIRANIEMHLEENVPMKLSEAIFEYFPVRTDSKRQVITVAVSVVPYHIVRDYTTILEKSGMTPVSFLIENQALARAVINYNDLSTYLIVQISERRTVLSIISDHAVQFTSSIPIGSTDFTEGLMREYKISKEDAEKMKVSTEYEGVDLDNNKLFAGMINAFSSIKDETQRACSYWQSFQDKLITTGSTSTSINKIILSGRDALLPGLQEYFSSSLNLPVETANVWQNVFDLKVTVPEIKFSDALDFGTAIGLALPRHKY
jgi:type IV pilus assembly protein PilM